MATNFTKSEKKHIHIKWYKILRVNKFKEGNTLMKKQCVQLLISIPIHLKICIYKVMGKVKDSFVNLPGHACAVSTVDFSCRLIQVNPWLVCFFWNTLGWDHLRLQSTVWHIISNLVDVYCLDMTTDYIAANNNNKIKMHSFKKPRANILSLIIT